MKIVIDTDKCKELGITLDEAFYLLALYSKNPIRLETFQQITSHGFMEYEMLRNGFPALCTISREGIEVAESLLLDSEYTEQREDSEGKIRDRFDILADKLRELFPKGRKEGTNLQWRDSTAIISKRLKTIVKKYGVTFTDEEAIDATKRYIESFNGDYRFMQVLMYFIFKNEVVNGVREERSQFMSYLQNKEDMVNNDWSHELV